MRYLADQNISPLTVSLLAEQGFDIRRVSDFLPANAADTVILELARQQEFTVITQDLDFSSIIASHGETRPSLVSIRLRDNRPEHIAVLLAKVLPGTESDLAVGAIITIEDADVRVRFLPVRQSLSLSSLRSISETHRGLPFIESPYPPAPTRSVDSQHFSELETNGVVPNTAVITISGRQPGIGTFKDAWMPACAGMTGEKGDWLL